MQKKKGDFPEKEGLEPHLEYYSAYGVHAHFVGAFRE